MKTPILSIIVPVYKTEKYLPECINSILNQSFTNFELILVDDGSPDNSGEICEQYTKTDSRIKVIHQQNQGECKARKSGWKQSIGDYIVFVDSDDTLPINAVEILYHHIHNQDIDIVIGNMIYLPTGKVKPMQRTLIGQTDYLNEVLSGQISCTIWGKIYKRNLLDEHVFDIPREIKMGPDYIASIRIGLKTKNIKIIPDIIYNYIQHDESVSHTFETTIEYEKKFCDLLFEPIYKARKEKELKKGILMQHLNTLRVLIKCNKLDINNPWIEKILKEIKPILSTTKDKIYLKLISIPFTYKIIQIYRFIKR